MKCRRDLWTKALDLAKHATDSKSTLVELANVEVTASGGRCVISGTDLQRRMRLQLPCEGDLELQTFDLQTLVQVTKAAKKTRGEEIEITPTSNGLQLAIAGRTFEVDREGTGDNRPKDWERTGETIIRSWDAKEFIRALDYVLPAMSKDETRFHLCAVAMTDGSLVTTDGHRMHKADNIESFGENTVLVDAGTAIAIKDAIKTTDADYVRARRFDGPGKYVEWSIEGPRLDALILAKPVEASFPRHQAVIPKNPESFQVESGPLRESLETATKLLKAKKCDPTYKGVEMHANGDLRITTDNGFKEVIALVKGATPEHHGGVNPRYVVDALRGVTGVAQIEYGTGLDPIAVRACDDLLAVVMPLRIK
jgi:DNA polymerase III sliding clamp (beta) subunit (PCNA family)